MEYKISRMIANKKKYIFHIIMVVFVLIAITISIIGSFAIYQYNTVKKNFVDNRFAKTIEISSYSDKSNEVRKLNTDDIKKIENILMNTGKKYKLITEHQINFGIQVDNDIVIFIKSFSDDFFIDNVIKQNTLITKKDFSNKKLYLNIPVISVDEGGYKSDISIKKEYDLYKLKESSILNNYIKEDEVIVSEEVFEEIVKIMFPQHEYMDIEKIYVNVDSIKDIKSIAVLLYSNNYNINHAFEYYDDLDTSVGKVINLSVTVLLILLIFTICLLTGLFELMLKNSAGDIAVLKHLGYTRKSIKRIYLYPMLLRSLASLIIICISNIVLYRLNVINSIYNIIVFQGISIMLCIIALIIMSVRVDYYSSKDVLSLIRSYKVEE